MKHRQVYILHGVAASAGIAIGHAVIIDRRKIERYPKIRITEGLIDDEIKRFDDAVEASYKQIDEAKKKLELHVATLELEQITAKNLVNTSTTSWPLDVNKVLSAIDDYDLRQRRIDNTKSLIEALFPSAA